MSSTDTMWSFVALMKPTWPLAVKLISFTCLAMGLMVSLPFILLIVYDFFLWVWRTIQRNTLDRATKQHRAVASGAAGSVQKPLRTKFD